MSRHPLSFALLATMSVLTLAACGGEPMSGSSRDPSATGYDRYDDVDRFPQPRASSPYMRQ